MSSDELALVAAQLDLKGKFRVQEEKRLAEVARKRKLEQLERERQRREAEARRRATLSPDQLAAEASEAAEGSVDELAAYLTSGWTGGGRELKQHRALLGWLVQKLTLLPRPSEAETAAMQGGGAALAEVALLGRTASALGCAALYKALADAALLRSTVVSGYGKPDGAPFSESHVWVRIEVEGAFHLVDPFFAAGFFAPDGSFVRAFDPFFWMTHPDHFAHTHLERVPPPTVDRVAAFRDSPRLTGGYFASGVELSSHMAVTIETPGGKKLVVSFKQTGAAPVILEGRLGDDAQTAEFKKGNHTFTFTVAKGAAPAPLRVSWRAEAASAEAFQPLVAYKVVAV